MKFKLLYSELINPSIDLLKKKNINLIQIDLKRPEFNITLSSNKPNQNQKSKNSGKVKREKVYWTCQLNRRK